MPINTLDDLFAATKFARFFSKLGATMTASTALRGWTPQYLGGIWAAGTGTSIGVNGEAVTPATTGITQPYVRTNPTSPALAYLAKFHVIGQTACSAWLVDRLWHNSGLSATLTSAQSITPAAIPARDINGTTNGEGVYAAIEWVTAAGAGTPTATITYTNEAGTSGRTATLASTSIASGAAGTIEIFQLQAGDKGIRSIQSFQWSATHTSGTFSLILFRPLAQVDCPTPQIGGNIDPFTGALPRLYDNTTFQIILFPSGTGACNISGMIVEAQK